MNEITKKAIIVEDNMILSVLYENYLKEMVFKTAGEVRDGDTAIQIVRKYRPDVIVMDIMLEGDMDGVQAANEIREFTSVPIIFITANSDDRIMKRAKRVPNSHFLVKPISEAKLKEAVNNMLGDGVEIN